MVPFAWKGVPSKPIRNRFSENGRLLSKLLKISILCTLCHGRLHTFKFGGKHLQLLIYGYGQHGQFFTHFNNILIEVGCIDRYLILVFIVDNSVLILGKSPYKKQNEKNILIFGIWTLFPRNWCPNVVILTILAHWCYKHNVLNFFFIYTGI